jgi:hypothetical protein
MAANSENPKRVPAALDRLRHRPETLAVCPTLCPNPSLHCRLFAPLSGLERAKATVKRQPDEDDLQ